MLTEEINDLSSYPFAPDLIPYAFAKKRLALPLQLVDNELLVAISSPSAFDVIEEIEMMSDYPVVAKVCSKELLLDAIETCYQQSEEDAKELIEGESTDAEIIDSEVYDLLDQSADSPVIRILNSIFIQAIQQGASDIHFEPEENCLIVRYRIDGVLQKRPSPPFDLAGQLMTRLKVVAKLDIAERRLPQDGRIKLGMAGREIDFRVSTVPIVHGERIVLRILDKGNVCLDLDQIGMPLPILADFREMIRHAQGIILVTGPTGSGKTTTLYSALSEIHSPELNVMTIEDPVEYKLPGMAQIGVNPKINLTFSAGLRHILRQDPDVIMIGEIRDKETAEIAIQSSLTGHLVLSTLHTNDAPSAMTRLVDMGVEPYLLSSTVVGVLAQRLVRMICPDCHENYIPSDEELAQLGITRSSLPQGQLSRGKGCEACFGSGYRGRMGIYELMEMTPAVKHALLSRVDAEGIKEVVEMQTLRDCGIDLACQGLTTSHEVLRVTR